MTMHTIPAPLKFVLSASRRTDIPAFYLDWFMDGMNTGGFDVKNPYDGRIRRITATPETVHTIVFWSKNFGPFLAGEYGRQLQNRGFNLFFNFTVNSESPLLEPEVPPLSPRLKQLSELAAVYGPESISWRFDPICRYQPQGGRPVDNLENFDQIAGHVGNCGISRCITSFMDLYPKIQRRTGRTQPVSFLPICTEEQIQILVRLQSRLQLHGIQLMTCCESDLQRALPPNLDITAAACIPNDLLVRLFGGHLSLKKDPGQRVGAGCGCKVSVDIGSYRQHPCYHNCRYCYANPSAPLDKMDKLNRLDKFEPATVSIQPKRGNP